MIIHIRVYPVIETIPRGKQMFSHLITAIVAN